MRLALATFIVAVSVSATLGYFYFNNPISDDMVSDFSISVYQGSEVVGGEDVNLYDLLQQDKPIVLNFWAPLCPPCRSEMPELQDFYDENKSKVLVLGVDVGPLVGMGSLEEGRAMILELGINYPSGTTLDADTMNKYKVLGMPSTYFINPNGSLYKTWVGVLDKNILTSITENMLK